MAQPIKFRAEAQRSLAAASIQASYTSIGAPIDHIGRQMIVQNFTDALLQFSFDGVVDHFVLPASGQMILDVTTNETDPAGWFISIGTQMSVKRIGNPTSGSVYVSLFYAGGN